MRKCAFFVTKARACEDKLDTGIVIQFLNRIGETVLGILLQELFQRAPDVDTHAWPGVVVNLAVNRLNCFLPKNFLNAHLDLP